MGCPRQKLIFIVKKVTLVAMPAGTPHARLFMLPSPKLLKTNKWPERVNVALPDS
jgi:hypothetical protein